MAPDTLIRVDDKNGYGLDVGVNALVGPPARDWQITTILPNDLFIETDCNSGQTRRIRKTICNCGQAMLIEFDAHSARADKKRIFYPDGPDDWWCVFRCKKCGEPVHDTVPGAEFS